MMKNRREDVQLDEWGDPIADSELTKTKTQSAAEAFEKSDTEDPWDDPEKNHQGRKPKSGTARSRDSGNRKVWILAAVCILATGIIAAITAPGAKRPSDGTGSVLTEIWTPNPSQGTHQLIVTDTMPEWTTPAPITAPPPTPTRTVTTTPTSTITKTPEPDLMAEANQWYGENLRYYYQQLTENEKELFGLIYSGIIRSKKTIDTGRNRYTKTELDRVMYVIRQDCPELFNFDGYFQYYSSPVGDTILSIEPKYRLSTEEYDKRQDRIRGIVADMKGKTRYLNDDYEREKAAYQYIRDHCTYQAVGVETARADSVLCEGKAQCAGYARGLSLLLRMMGIPCIQVTSEALNHEWNMVQINHNWYQCDVTWDDGGYNQSYPRSAIVYMNLPDRLVKKHVPDREEGFTFPACTHLEDNCVYREGIYIAGNIADKKSMLTRRMNEEYDRGSREILIMIDEPSAFANRMDLIRDFTDQHSRTTVWIVEETETNSFFVEVE